MRGVWAQMNLNTVMETSREERPCIEELGDDEPQVGVVNMAIIRYTAIGTEMEKKTVQIMMQVQYPSDS